MYPRQAKTQPILPAFLNTSQVSSYHNRSVPTFCSLHLQNGFIVNIQAAGYPRWYPSIKLHGVTLQIETAVKVNTTGRRQFEVTFHEALGNL